MKMPNGPTIKRLASLILIAVFLVPAGAGAGAQGRLIQPGDFFPDYRFPSDLSTPDAAYLGLSDKMGTSGEFRAEDVWGSLIVLELFNRYCFSCRLAAPIFNRAYDLVASDPGLSIKVRFLGVGVGNNARVVKEFRDEFSVPFPLIPDPRLRLLDALGNPGGTPFTLLLRRTVGGMVVMDAHFGVFDSPEVLVAGIRDVLSGDIDKLVEKAPPSEVADWSMKELKPPLSEDALFDRVEASMKRAGYGTVGIHTVKLPSGDEVYVGESKRGKVFSRVVNRLPLCDVCHPIHFILTFNPKGEIVDFDAIYVTKYWNRTWNDKEVAAMRKKLLGLSVLEDREFDPEVDAISTATMSSTLIFDSVGKTGKVFELLMTSQ